MAKEIPNYLVTSILRTILDYLLLSKKDYSNNKFEYSKTLFNDNSKNEIIKLSLVSKTWFNIITTLISNNITSDNNLHRWVNYKESLDHIVFSSDIDNSNNNNNNNKKKFKINSPFSIIRINKEIILNHFNSECKIIDDNSQFQLKDGNHLETHKNTIFNINTVELLENGLSDILPELNVSDDIGRLSTNLEFNLNNINLKSMEQVNKIINLVTNNFKRNNLIINRFTIEELSCINGIDNEILKYLIEKLKFRNIKITPYEINDQHDLVNHLNYSWLFEQCSIESIKLKYDHMEPIYFSKLNINGSNSNLKILSYSFLFHEMIKLIRQDSTYYSCDSYLESFNNPNSIQDDFQIMVKELSINKTIKKLTINNICQSGSSCLVLKNQTCPLHPISKTNPTFCTIDGLWCFNKRKENQKKLNEKAKSIINQGFKSIFENNSCIEFFKISNLDILDETFFDGLIKNSTIKTLVIKSIGPENSNRVFDHLISNVLTVNNSIKHLIVAHDVVLNIFQLLIKNQNQINLYSINLIVTHNNINDLIDLISSPSTTIVEFNLILYPKNQNLDLISNIKNTDKVINIF